MTNTTSNKQGAETKFKVGDSVFHIGMDRPGEVIAVGKQATGKPVTTIQFSCRPTPVTYIGDTMLGRFVRKLEPEITFKVGDHVTTDRGQGIVTGTFIPCNPSEYLDSCFADVCYRQENDLETFVRYSFEALQKAIKTGKAAEPSEGPEEEIIDAARRLGVENCNLAQILGRLDSLSAKLQDANERADRLSAALNHAAEERGKAVLALQRAGFVRNERSGEWKPPVNLAAAEARLLRDTVEAQREEIEGLKGELSGCRLQLNAAEGELERLKKRNKEVRNNGLDCALKLNALRNAVRELREADRLVEENSGGTWVRKAPPRAIQMRRGRAWAAVNELLDADQNQPDPAPAPSESAAASRIKLSWTLQNGPDVHNGWWPANALEWLDAYGRWLVSSGEASAYRVMTEGIGNG